MGTQYVQHSVAEPKVPEHNAARTTLLENDEVLVVANTYPPGTSAPIHTHRFPSVVYVVEGGRIETTGSDGSVETYDVRPGQTMWSDSAHAHASRNAGSTPVKLVEIEIKHAAAPGEKASLVVTPDNLEWQPDPLDPRRAAALIVGDPTQPGPFAVRYRVPAKYEMGMHVHPDEDEQLTVLSGTISWSSGAGGSDAPEYVLTPGAFVMTPAGMPHRIVAVEESILQLSGIGPRTYRYVNAADDPRVKP